MKTPTIAQNAERPSGVMPPYTQYVVIAVIALVVVVATLWSGGPKPRKSDEPASPVGPTPTQLKSFQQVLERQRQEVEEAQKRQAQAKPMPPVQAQGPAVADATLEQRRKSATPAPVTSNYVLHAGPTVSVESPPLDVTSQMIALTPIRANGSEGEAHAETPTAARAKSADLKQDAAKPETPPKESGKSLPPQEGNLFRLYEGTLVRAKLANRLDGSFTGPVTCVVATAVSAQDKAVFLIPVGARLLGKASKVEAQNQTRLAMTFKRMILPNGYSIDLEAAPGLDSEGETGLKGKVENHPLKKFGLAGAVGVLGGLALYGGMANPYAAGVATSEGNAATNILNHALNVVPTITVPEGHPVNIYLPGDLLLPPYKP